MATLSAVTRPHLLTAIAEYDDRGKEAFIGVYGLQPSTTEELVHEGRSYDAAVVVGVAHRYATGRVATSDELGKQADGVAALLRKHGFEVTPPQGAARTPARVTKPRATAPRTPRATTPRVSRSSADERPPVICPTCFTQLPATGTCDNCA
ncbi:hypothetical protein [Xylanimonas cellulosilytica]|uniref:hypothetical protein n=1 Tax=Xylanimonas cellulosilytica TaxID=186189 RepID=UPI00019C06E7|nr:hypothetical protein [Xylanimonas cellulosilytica]